MSAFQFSFLFFAFVDQLHRKHLSNDHVKVRFCVNTRQSTISRRKKHTRIFFRAHFDLYKVLIKKASVEETRKLASKRIFLVVTCACAFAYFRFILQTFVSKTPRLDHFHCLNVFDSFFFSKSLVGI